MEETSWRNLTAEVPLLLAAALISYLSFLVVLYSAELLPTITNAMNVRKFFYFTSTTLSPLLHLRPSFLRESIFTATGPPSVSG